MSNLSIFGKNPFSFQKNHKNVRKIFPIISLQKKSRCVHKKVTIPPRIRQKKTLKCHKSII